MRKKLILSDGVREREIQLVGRIVVGRDPACEISHDDSLLSRRHAEFVTAGGAVTVRDLGSRNGVFVNGTRAAEHRLEPGDIVQIGPLRACFVVEHAPSSITPEELDVERTAVFRRGSGGVPPSAAVPHMRAAVPVSTPLSPAVETDDQDVTRLIAAPRMPTPRPGVDRPSSSPVVDSDAERRESGPAAVDRELSAFVFVSLLTFAAAILAAAALPVAMWRTAAMAASAATGASVSLVWLALPVVVALVGTYFIGAVINRRITGTLAAGERKRT